MEELVPHLDRETVGAPQETVHQRIRALRLTRGLTQREVAMRCGLDPSYYNRVEHGKVGIPTRETLIRIVEAIGCSLEERAELFIRANYAKADIDISPQLLEVFRLASLLTEAERQAVIDDMKLQVFARQLAPPAAEYQAKVRALLDRQEQELKALEDELEKLRDERQECEDDLLADVSFKLEERFSAPIAELERAEAELCERQEVERAELLAEGEEIASRYPEALDARRDIMRFPSARKKASALIDDEDLDLCAE